MLKFHDSVRFICTFEESCLQYIILLSVRKYCKVVEKESSSHVWVRCSDVSGSIFRFHDQVSNIIFQMAWVNR